MDDEGVAKRRTSLANASSRTLNVSTLGCPEGTNLIGQFMANPHGVILIVEDEALVRMGTAGELQDEGFTVIEAANAAAAIALLETEPSINLMLTDIDMPGSMNGLKLAAAVRNRWPPVLIIVTSGQFKISQDDLPLGSRFFPKPYLTSVLAAAFRDMAA